MPFPELWPNAETQRLAYALPLYIYLEHDLTHLYHTRSTLIDRHCCEPCHAAQTPSRCMTCCSFIPTRVAEPLLIGWLYGKLNPETENLELVSTPCPPSFICCAIKSFSGCPSGLIAHNCKHALATIPIEEDKKGGKPTYKSYYSSNSAADPPDATETNTSHTPNSNSQTSPTHSAPTTPLLPAH